MSKNAHAVFPFANISNFAVRALRGAVGLILFLAVVVFSASPVWATSGGIDTPNGINELPLSVGGAAGIDIVTPGTTPTQLVGSPSPHVIIPGSVAVGTTQPRAKLDVEGAIKPGYVKTGAACSPEGAFGYDKDAHVPVYCNQSGIWATQGGSLSGLWSCNCTSGYPWLMTARGLLSQNDLTGYTCVNLMDNGGLAGNGYPWKCTKIE